MATGMVLTLPSMKLIMHHQLHPTSSSSFVWNYFLPTTQNLHNYLQPFKTYNDYDFRPCYRFSGEDLLKEDDEDCSFDEAVFLFNNRDYYRCHDLLESLWNRAEEPVRILIHGILQCTVGFYHLFNQNHRGAMMELGEGLCKLRKMNFDTGPFRTFELEISASLDFIYQTQFELAACTDDLCLTLDGSERSYQLLGSFASGQHLYSLESDPKGLSYIVFCPEGSNNSGKLARVKVPTLHATKEHLMACQYS